MAYYLRTRGPDSHVMHDRCADAQGVAHAGRKGFGQKHGGDLCWTPVYALSSIGNTVPPCHFCDDAVDGRG